MKMRLGKKGKRGILGAGALLMAVGLTLGGLTGEVAWMSLFIAGLIPAGVAGLSLLPKRHCPHCGYAYTKSQFLMLCEIRHGELRCPQCDALLSVHK